MNYNDEPKCAKSTWEVFDLKGRITKRFIYLKPKSSILVGILSEETWSFGNLEIELGGSGYVDQFYSIDPYTEHPYDEKENCIFPKED